MRLSKLFKVKKQKAFSLIETLLVVGIIAFVFVFSAKVFIKKDNQVKSFFERLIQLNHRLAVLSKAHNKTYRLVFELSVEGPDQYWVEKEGGSSQSLDDTEDLEAEGDLQDPEDLEDEKDQQDLKDLQDLQDQQDSQDEDSSGFEKDRAFYSTAQELPSFLDIVDIETQNSIKQEKKVFIYYYPSALGQESRIRFLRSDNKTSSILYLDPVSRQMILLKGKK